jgi:catechol-2,3-dioxygenase
MSSPHALSDGKATPLKVIDETLTPRPIDARVGIGHVHLKVADLDRALAFYCGVLGFQLMQRYGGHAAFISAGGYHHHIGLNTWESQGGSPPPRGQHRPLSPGHPLSRSRPLPMPCAAWSRRA